MNFRKQSLLRGAALVCVCVTASATLAAQVATSCAQVVRAAAKAGSSGFQIEQAMETLQELVKNHQLQVLEYAKVGKELANLQNSTLFAGPSSGNAADWITITNNTNITADELVEVIDSFSQYLRKSDGTALPGAEFPASPDQTLSLVKELVSASRPAFFRASGPRSLVLHAVPIQGRAVSPGSFQAADVTVSASTPDGVAVVSSDLVLAATGGSDFVAFKASGSSFTEAEIRAAYQAVLNPARVTLNGALTSVNSFTFVVESTLSLPQLVTTDTGVSIAGLIAQLQAGLPDGQQSKLALQQASF